MTICSTVTTKLKDPTTLQKMATVRKDPGPFADKIARLFIAGDPAIHQEPESQN